MTVKYQKGFFRLSTLLQVKGSVFRYSLIPALCCGLASILLKLLLREETIAALYQEHLQPNLIQIMSNNIGFQTYSVLVTFLVTFRTGKAYDRFWNGANYIKRMQAEYFVTASNLVAFCRHSGAGSNTKHRFQHTLIRLLSMLHAVSLHQLSVGGDGVNIAKTASPTHTLIDIYGVDVTSVQALRDEECRVELIVQWIQSLTVDGIKTGVCTIPPPILSRIFQNMSNGLTAYYSAYRVTEVSFPFPYVQVTEVFLLFHVIVTPIVIQSFSTGALWSGIFSFLATFVLWSVNFIAAELENPFSQTVNVLDMHLLQSEFNKRLILLLKSHTNKVPSLSEACIMDVELLQECFASYSFKDIWHDPFPSSTVFKLGSDDFGETKDYAAAAAGAGGGSAGAVKSPRQGPLPDEFSTRIGNSANAPAPETSGFSNSAHASSPETSGFRSEQMQIRKKYANQPPCCLRVL
eukprot:TRINITY_DN17241_c0_g1_i1.p1 TRINITY_DN17241_c0_g1~~TRINITY_DN17241_c0_g1_i1.p1  ORF type:complete len:463 (+),score=44.09 TRINITY_DN17241_c0_g1_i1:113-1501(+)